MSYPITDLQGIDGQAVAALRSAGIRSTGALLEKTLPFLPSDGGARLLLHLHALVIGLYPHACPSDVVARALRHPGLELLRLDFPTELRVSTRALIEGMRALSLQSGKEP